MATFHFDLVSPEKLLFSGEVDQVDAPGAEGDFGVLAGHAALVAALRPGVISVYQHAERLQFLVQDGIAAVDGGMTVLAQSAAPYDQIEPAEIELSLKNAEDDLANAADDQQRDRALARVHQLRAVRQALESQPHDF